MIDTSKLKARMVEKGITQRALSQKTGYGLNHINEVINNKTSPRLELVQKIREILEITDPEDMTKIFFTKSVPNMEQEEGKKHLMK